MTENLVQGNFIGTNAAGTGGIGNGSGVVIINPPWKLLQHLKTLLPPLARRLAGSTGKPQTNFYDLHAK